MPPRCKQRTCKKRKLNQKKTMGGDISTPINRARSRREGGNLNTCQPPLCHTHIPRLFASTTLILPTSSHLASCHRRNRVQDSRHLARRHCVVRERANLRALPQPLQANRNLPALRLINQEDVLLAVTVADARAEDMEMFGGLLAGLSKGQYGDLAKGYMKG